MPMSLLLALGFAVTPCPEPSAAPDVASARRIAERVIAALPHRPGRYVLRVMPLGMGYHGWRFYESPAGRPGMRGGGGVSIDIERCTGAVSNFHYQR